VGRVIFDLRHLEFMNSSCFKAFVTFLQLVKASPQQPPCEVHFKASETYPWQKRSLSALSCVAIELVKIDVVP
jgi:hypothetical protein